MGKQDAEWESQARHYQADGYTGGVVARKMISVHDMPEPAALELVGRLYGKQVNPRAGDTTTAAVIGLGLAVAGFGGVAFLFMLGGLRGRLIPLYVALLGVAGKGVQQLVVALVNAGVKEPLQK